MNSSSVINTLLGFFGQNKDKLTWSGTLEDLKAFVLTIIDEQTAQNSIWHSPSGGKWCFDSEQLKVTWYSKSGTICFDGTKAKDLCDKIHSVLLEFDCQKKDQSSNLKKSLEQQNLSERMQSVNINPKASTEIGEENNMVELHVVHDSGVNDDDKILRLYAADNDNSSVEDLRRQMQEYAESTNSTFEDIETELNNLKARSVPLFVMEAAVKELKKDKDSLLKENAELREKNLNYALITSDLNSKVKSLSMKEIAWLQP